MLVSEKKIKVLTPTSYFRFLTDRFIRLYPAYLAALLLVVGMVSVAHLIRWRVNVPLNVPFPITSLPLEVLMVQHWRPGFVSWNYPAWSISVLWWCCIFLFPVLFFVVRKVTDWRLLSLIVVFLVGAYASIRSQNPSDEIGIWIVLISRVTFPFAIGAILFAIWREKGAPPPWLANLTATAGVGGFLGAHYFAPAMGLIATTTVITSLILVVLSAGWPSSFIYSIMEKPLFVSLGKASYSIYLSHSVAERVAVALMPPNSYVNESFLIRFIVFLGYLALLAGGIAAFYFIIDRSCEKLHRTWARKLSAN